MVFQTQAAGELLQRLKIISAPNNPELQVRQFS